MLANASNGCVAAGLAAGADLNSAQFAPALAPTDRVVLAGLSSENACHEFSTFIDREDICVIRDREDIVVVSIGLATADCFIVSVVFSTAVSE